MPQRKKMGKEKKDAGCDSSSSSSFSSFSFSSSSSFSEPDAEQTNRFGGCRYPLYKRPMRMGGGIFKSEGSSCYIDQQCGTGLLCTNGTCQERQECGHFWQRCAPGKTCQNGMCTAATTGGFSVRKPAFPSKFMLKKTRKATNKTSNKRKGGNKKK
jgi:hypothetical protein